MIRERVDSCNTKLVIVDVDNLFTNVPVLKTINIILDRIFPTNKSAIIHGMNKDNFESLLKLVVTDSYFTFNDQLYRQIDCVAMGSPFGPIFAYIFMSAHESKWQEKCPLKPLLYRHYLDDTLLICKENDNVSDFASFLNIQHPNLHFTYETEKDHQLPFMSCNDLRLVEL